MTPSSPFRHLRARGEAGTQRITNVEVFFDLVYVFAITQLSHLVLADPSIGGLASAAFLLVVVWWAWIYTTWMANWFDPSSRAVTAVLGAVMLASLLMAAAIPGALGDHGGLFAASYVALQVGRNAAAVSLLARDHRLRDVFERLLVWSVGSGALWLGGAILESDQRLLLWIPALVLDLAAPAAGYWLPGRGRAVTTDYDIEGGHFAERCQLFVIIALGESIVVTGATAANHGLTLPVVTGLVLAFVETVALWWLYFGAPTEDAHAAVTAGEDPGRVARDAYTYVHPLIIAGIIATAAGDNLLIANPDDPLHGVGLAIVLGGPALFLLGQNLFAWMTTGTASLRRLAAAGVIVGLVPLGPQVPALVLAAVVTAVLSALAGWEATRAGRRSEPSPGGAGGNTLSPGRAAAQPPGRQGQHRRRRCPRTRRPAGP